MKTEITNGELVNSMIPSLLELLKLATPIKVNYAANKTLNVCDSAKIPIEKTRNEIFTGLCLMDEKEKPITKNNEYQFASDEIKQKAIDKVSELYAMKIEIEIHTVPIELMNEIEGKTVGTWINYLVGKFFIENPTQ